MTNQDVFPSEQFFTLLTSDDKALVRRAFSQDRRNVRVGPRGFEMPPSLLDAEWIVSVASVLYPVGVTGIMDQLADSIDP